MSNPRYLTQSIPEGQTPTIRLLHFIRGDFCFAGTFAEPGIHKAYMNRYGAVSVIAENGRLLGVMPSEMEWVSGEPSRWGHSDRNTVYVIEPYEGDWTLDAARKLEPAS